jgi:hypothetical protein
MRLIEVNSHMGFLGALFRKRSEFLEGGTDKEITPGSASFSPDTLDSSERGGVKGREYIFSGDVGNAGVGLHMVCSEVWSETESSLLLVFK